MIKHNLTFYFYNSKVIIDSKIGDVSVKKNVLKVFLFSCFCFLSYSIIGLANIQFDPEIEMKFNCPDPSMNKIW